MRNILFASVILFSLISLFSCQKTEDPILLKPNAGTDFVDIENDGYQVQLAAQPALGGQSGIWRVYVGTNGEFDDANNPKTIFRGEPGENYLIGWELSEGDQYEAATISVGFKPLVPQVYHTSGDTLFNNHTYHLEAAEPKFGAQGKWEIVEGDGARIDESELAHAYFMGQKNTYYKVKWSLIYGSKKVSVEFDFVTDEFRAMAGPDQLDIISNKDETKYYSLEAYLPPGATGAWELLSGQEGKVLKNNAPNSLFEGVADTVYTLAWNVELDGETSVDTVQVRFRGKWSMWTDPLDGQSYRVAAFNGLEWMAENYNGAISPGYHSWYYGFAERAIISEGHGLETDEERKRHGRLYTWPGAYYATPEGWRLPTPDEYNDLMTQLGGPIYGHDKLIEGGDTGIDFIHSGYFIKYSIADPALRAAFEDMGSVGTYWTDQYNEVTGKAVGKSIFKDATGFGLISVGAEQYGLSVRYVREVQ